MFKKTKKGLIAVVATLSLSSMMAAMSYSSASVSSDMSVDLVNTQDALLALVASDEHNAAFYNATTADMLNIDLSRGNGDKGEGEGSYGVQPNSKYEWDDLFKVKNNSEHAVDVTVKLQDNVGSRIEINGKAEGEKWTKLNGIHSAGGEITFTLAAGEEQAIDIQTKSLNGWEAEKATKLIVEGEKAQ